MSSSGAEAAITEACRRFHLPGVSASIAVLDRPTMTVVGGYAHLRLESPVVPGTRFRIGSVSKALTSIALARLVGAGMIDLEAPVQRYLPGFPTKGAWPMTIRQLAAHTSGLPHYRMKDFLNRRNYATLTDALDKFAERQLLFEPGAGFAYSSFGWNLLGAALEAAGRQPFDELMSNLVFSPLGMADTAVETTSRAEQQARPYLRVRNRIVPAPRIDPSDALPSAGFIATTADLVRAGRAMATSEVISPTEVDLLWTESITPDGTPTGYGLGWHRIELSASSGWGHGGSHVGATALLAVLPDLGVTVAVATNTNGPPGALTTISEQLIRATTDL